MRNRAVGSPNRYGGIVPARILLEDMGLIPPLPPEVTVEPAAAGREVGMQLAATQAPAEMLTAIVRAYAAVLLKKPDVRTAEDRSRVLKVLRKLLDDAILDAVRDVRPPDAPLTPPPGEAPQRS